MEILKKIKESLIEGNSENVSTLTKQALENGISPEMILNDGMIPGMDIIGEKFQAHEIYLPEMLISARAMKAGMAILRPLLVNTGIEPIAKVVIGTVKGDLHDIGKNLVAMMLEGGGFEVTDAGVDVSPEKFLELTNKIGADILGLSALITTTKIEMKNTIKFFKEKGARDTVKIIVGGAPVDNIYAREIGADGYASDAAEAVDLVRGMIKK
jgi:5-methyltetrahydrofolate--homocysteine methyltransferase